MRCHEACLHVKRTCFFVVVVVVVVVVVFVFFVCFFFLFFGGGGGVQTLRIIREPVLCIAKCLRITLADGL